MQFVTKYFYFFLTYFLHFPFQTILNIMIGSEIHKMAESYELFTVQTICNKTIERKEKKNIE
ncbi:hypothetical protein D7X25_15250 [bacterium 1XD42-8]|nr:hypothetical protein D7X25_15250 [bacterium 1XD42-8]